MKTLSAGMLTHIALGTTTLCTCWKVTRTDGAVFGFTDHDVNLTVSGVPYLAATGYTASAIASAAALNVDNLEVEGALNASAITEADLIAGLWDFAEVEIFQVNYADLTMGTIKLRKGWIGEVRIGKGVFVAELRGMMQLLQQAIGRTVGPACNADLGDARCGVNLALFTGTGAITTVGSTRIFAVGAFAGLHPDNWFDGGLVTFLTGNNAGLSMEIKTYNGTTATFILFQPMPFTLAPGDTLEFSAGCDKSLTTCRTKFNNVINFRGFPHLPGITRVASGT